MDAVGVALAVLLLALALWLLLGAVRGRKR